MLSYLLCIILTDLVDKITVIKILLRSIYFYFIQGLRYVMPIDYSPNQQAGDGDLLYKRLQ